MPDDDELTPPEDPLEVALAATDPVAPPPTIAAPASIALTPDMVRNSPEYRELQNQNRILARKAGTAEQAAATARSAAEQSRLAAEAEAQEAQARRIEEVLGPDGIAAWNQISELSATDPVAAAIALQNFRLSAQSAGVGDLGDVALPVVQEGAPAVPAQGTGAPTPPPMASALHADSPLGSIAPQDNDDATISALDQRFNNLASRAQHPLSENRLTERERNEGIMAHFARGVVTTLKQRRQGT